jgi:hypothetical protein
MSTPSPINISLTVLSLALAVESDPQEPDPAPYELDFAQTLPHECPIASVANTSPAPLATIDQSLLQVLPNSSTPPFPHIVTQSMTSSLQPKLFPNFKLYHSLKSTKHPLKALSSVILPQVPITVA